MDFQKNKIVIIAVVVTLLLSSAGIFFANGKNGISLFKNTETSSSSSKSQIADTKMLVEKNEFGDELSELDGAISAVNPDEFNVDTLSDSEIGLE